MISEYPFDSNLSSSIFYNKQLRVKSGSNVRVSRCGVTWVTVSCELRPYFPLVAKDETGIERSPQ